MPAIPPEPTGHERPTDDELTIALAEYGYIAEARRSLNDQSSARFNFFLVVTTAVAAVAAGLLSSGNVSTATLTAIGTLGVLTMVVGVAIFVRLVEFSKRGMRYVAAQDALRTYLAGRVPRMARYMLMPVIGDNAVMLMRPGFRRDSISLAGTVGLLNSMLLALAGALMAGIAATGWILVTAALALFGASFAAHMRYIRVALRRCGVEIAMLLSKRGLSEE